LRDGWFPQASDSGLAEPEIRILRHFDLPKPTQPSLNYNAHFMKLYGIHFLTHGSDVFAVELVSAENDEAAKKQADRLRTRFGKGHEIWDGDRLVEKVDY
jgi:hypothetical protein